MFSLRMFLMMLLQLRVASTLDHDCGRRCETNETCYKNEICSLNWCERVCPICDDEHETCYPGYHICYPKWNQPYSKCKSCFTNELCNEKLGKCVERTIDRSLPIRACGTEKHCNKNEDCVGHVCRPLVHNDGVPAINKTENPTNTDQSKHRSSKR